ncbi:OmpP1/FadL family transporter [Thalassospira sp. MIT1370]|uniref:OmpP1/FadL family transporter n=1 Tax=unclassified Thalassospira TaxID=2648997 RepID=UPI00399C3D58
MSKLKMSCLWGAASGTAILCALATIGTAHASGFQVRETSGTLQGSSFAGMSTLTTDASTMSYNPGSVGQYKETTYSAGVTVIRPVARAQNVSASGGTLNNAQNFSSPSDEDMANDAVVPNAHAVWQLSEQMNLGVSITSPWGLVTDYEGDFAGRYYGTTSSIKTINIKPVLGYRFDNGLSIGAGPQIQYMDAALSKAVDNLAGTGEGSSKVSGDSLDYGWTAGINWEMTPSTTLGLSYISEVEHKLKGKIEFDSAAKGFAAPYVDRNATATVSTPESITFGIAQKLDDQWTVMADAQWTNWNTIDTLTFKFDGLTNAASATSNSSSDEYKWGSAWFGSLGARYQHDENWAFTGGIAFDETPIKTQYRNVRLPDSNRYWTSLGASYQVSDWAMVSLGYTHIFADEARVDHTTSNFGTFRADYEAHVDIIALQANFKF